MTYHKTKAPLAYSTRGQLNTHLEYALTMIMDNRLLVARRKYDPDATRYINAVQLADGQALEPEVAMAIDAFVRGCKADSAGYAGDPTRTVWDALKASCILCGARTISGALVPLVGAAPMPVNLASGDYQRGGSTPGIKGDGSTKYLNTNVAANDFSKDDTHGAVYVSAKSSSYGRIYFGNSNGNTYGCYPASSSTMQMVANHLSGTAVVSSAGIGDTTGLVAVSRTSSSLVSYLAGSISGEASSVSADPLGENFGVFARINGAFPSDMRAAFYSFGAGIDLSILDARVSTLVAAIAAAI